MQNPPNLLRVTLHLVHDAVVTTDGIGRVRHMNRAAEELTGWSEAEAEGEPVERVVDLRESGSDQPLLNPVYAALHRDSAPQPAGNVLLLGKDARRTAVELSASSVPGASDGPDSIEACVLTFRNVNESVALAERMAYQAQHDPLTGLPNRILLVDRMEQGARFADRNNERMAVIFIDLDRFTNLKLAYGTAIADELLKDVSSRLTDALRESDTVCRLGRDEFVALLSAVKVVEQIDAVAAKLLQEVSRPYRIGNETIQVTCSIGVSIYPNDASDTGTLMRLADGAMATAKKDGRNCIRFTRPFPAESMRIEQAQTHFTPGFAN